ncbi:hypothetical protein, partial [Salinispora arenicola]|uniref:hypothetical protein n=1 Tax=Salinispora arenicola TaxID=168697 RepID=UPI0027DE5A5D
HTHGRRSSPRFVRQDGRTEPASDDRTAARTPPATWNTDSDSQHLRRDQIPPRPALRTPLRLAGPRPLGP